MPSHYGNGNGKKMDKKKMDKKKTSSKKPTSKKPAKGSKEMKEKMARLRAMRGKK